MVNRIQNKIFLFLNIKSKMMKIIHLLAFLTIKIRVIPCQTIYPVQYKNGNSGTKWVD
jgi:hypothetical protein